jgi:hypothetical protein
VILLAAALVPGAAVSRAHACSFAPFDLEAMVAGAETIVVVEVETATRARAELQPEVFLKGPVTAGHLVLTDPDRASSCEVAAFEPGRRFVLFLNGSRWPYSGQVLHLEGGTAVSPTGGYTAPETETLAAIRGLTEQYAVPPRSQSESQGIDWWKTVVPVGAAVLGIFAAGLFLMRIWHRIDPS